MKVKAAILKHETVSARAVEMAKTFEDFDWKTRVHTNTFKQAIRFSAGSIVDEQNGIFAIQMPC